MCQSITYMLLDAAVVVIVIVVVVVVVVANNARVNPFLYQFTCISWRLSSPVCAFGAGVWCCYCNNAASEKLQVMIRFPQVALFYEILLGFVFPRLSHS